MANSTLTILAGCRLYCLLFCMAVLFLPSPANTAPVAGQLINNGGYIVDSGPAMLKYREQDLFIPASTIKILTCLAALQKLGKGYRFQTHFYLDEQNNLYIKGFGDPFLTSEIILQIGNTLAESGLRQLNSLFLDDTAFSLNGETAGGENSANPYDAPNGALAVNFNALPVQVSRTNGIASGEPETPLIPLMKAAGSVLSPGNHRININTLPSPGHLSPALRYTGELFIAQFERAGIRIQKGYNKKSVPKELSPAYYIHQSVKSLEETIRACLEYSNNFIANQLFLACGAELFGLPASWQKARQTFAAFAEQSLQLSPKQISVQEGSGLSRKNRISPAALLTILHHFKPFSRLLNQKNDILLKSGTLQDVYCYVGYLPLGKELIPFAILLNQSKNNRDGVLEILHEKTRQYKTNTITQ
ncbi:MAG: D-alanyl-D-alanine carboxypeptidase [Desulforhopalus sp.]